MHLEKCVMLTCTVPPNSYRSLLKTISISISSFFATVNFIFLNFITKYTKIKCVTSKHLFSFIFPDAFARVIFGDKAADTSVIWETRNPTWNQTLIFNDIIIWGSMDHVVENPPTIIIEIFDFDDGVRKRV